MRTHLETESVILESYIQLKVNVRFTDLTPEEFDLITCSDKLEYLKEHIFREMRLIEDLADPDRLPF